LNKSGALNDEEKVLSYFWSDGLNGQYPHPSDLSFFASGVATARGLNLVQTAKMFYIAFNALFDAGIAAWDTKRVYDSVRPITAIQCLYAGQTVRAWKGPYRGTGLIDGSDYIPFQLPFFIEPPFPEYVSGHSTFSAAIMTSFSIYFGSDDYDFSVTIPAGTNPAEPKITSGNPGFISGVTNVPNHGSGTVGYSPASDVTLSYSKFSDIAHDIGESRLFGGIHIDNSNLDGRHLGEKIAQKVFDKYRRLVPNDGDDFVPIPGADGNTAAGNTHDKRYLESFGIGRDVVIREPSMCDGASWWQGTWNSSTNSLGIDVRFFGLPYRPTICDEYDPSTPYNVYPSGCVENGRWQPWIFGYTSTITWIYTSTGILIGNEYDVGGQSVPADAINVTGTAYQAIGFDFFDPEAANLFYHLDLDLEYSQLKDNVNTGGALLGVVQADLSDPFSRIFFWTDAADLVKPIPVLSWGDILNQIIDGGAITIQLSYEPSPKPSYLTSRPNSMTGWSNIWANPSNPWSSFPLGALPSNGEQCGTFQLCYPGDFDLFPSH